MRHQPLGFDTFETEKVESTSAGKITETLMAFRNITF
jgi:hypothetical protein